MSAPFLQAVEVGCERDWRLLFDALNVALVPGDMLQVSGPNGSGKTSLLRLLAGLMSPHCGEILLQGKPLQSQRHHLAQHLLWLGHAPGIKGILSAEENLAWLCALRQTPMARAQIWEALAAVDLRGFEDVPCHALSAGQQRRVALARLYLSPPPLWILDEPFTALDLRGVAQLEAHLVGHCRRGGMVVLTTHHHLGQVSTGFRRLELGQEAAL